MKSEIIFRHLHSEYDRWGAEEFTETVILADFNGAAAWPWSIVKRSYTMGDAFDPTDDEETEISCERARISKAVFDSVKNIIASYPELATCREITDDSMSHYYSDSYLFTCDEFSRKLSNAANDGDEESLPRSERSAAYFAKEIITKINLVISQSGITI